MLRAGRDVSPSLSQPPRQFLSELIRGFPFNGYIPAGDVGLGLLAMAVPRCPYGIVLTASMDLHGHDATTCNQWIFVPKAPPVGKVHKHIYCAVVFIDHALVIVMVPIISPLVGESHLVISGVSGVLVFPLSHLGDEGSVSLQ